MRQIRLTAAELPEFNSKTQSNATYIWQHFTQSHNRRVFFLGNITLILKSNIKNELNVMFISHHFIQPHNR